jgi:hypothetical protein
MAGHDKHEPFYYSFSALDPRLSGESIKPVVSVPYRATDTKIERGDAEHGGGVMAGILDKHPAPWTQAGRTVTIYVCADCGAPIPPKSGMLFLFKNLGRPSHRTHATCQKVIAARMTRNALRRADRVLAQAIRDASCSEP